MGSGSGLGRLAAIVVVALLLGGGYTAYAGNRVYGSLQSGRQDLVEAQAGIEAAQHSGDIGQLQRAASQMAQAEQDFSDAERRSRTDPGLRAASIATATAHQLDGAAHLGAIGADLSRAGEAAAAIALQTARLKQQYAGRQLTPADLETILQQAQSIATNYQGSIDQIGRELKAAHDERSAVTTTGLWPPLRTAYDEVDRVLSEGDTAFARYQDVRRELSDLLNVALPG